MVPARAPADGTAAAACEPQVRDERYDSSLSCTRCLFSGFACSCAGPAAPLLAVAAAAACANESFSKPPPVRAAAGAAEDAQPELGAPLVSRLGVRRFGDTLQPNTQPLGVSAFGGNPATNIFDEVRAGSARPARTQRCAASAAVLGFPRWRAPAPRRPPAPRAPRDARSAVAQMRWDGRAVTRSICEAFRRLLTRRPRCVKTPRRISTPRPRVRRCLARRLQPRLPPPAGATRPSRRRVRRRRHAHQFCLPQAPTTPRLSSTPCPRRLTGLRSRGTASRAARSPAWRAPSSKCRRAAASPPRAP